jgi:MoaA/NifB/PqqE/SkfB family radical SAM enzyme
MTVTQSLYHRYRRYRTLQTHKISALPIVILMPHSACNCRCVMCDIWKDNKNLKQLNEDDINALLQSLKKLGTQQVLMSGGEALLNPKFFTFCNILKKHGIRITLLSTGLTIEKNAEAIIQYVHDVIVSLDGDEKTHDSIRNIDGAFQKIKAGVRQLRKLDPSYPVSARTVIHRLNFRQWPAIIEAAKELRLNQISFLPADVSSHAFNREVLWSSQRQHEILPNEQEVNELSFILEDIIRIYMDDFSNGFIAENPSKLRKIVQYYSAFYDGEPFPWKKCNAPWVSAVIEADGTVRPCFFHAPLGNIRDNDLVDILNSEQGIRFRKELDMEKDSTCAKCVCYLNLSPGTRIS